MNDIMRPNKPPTSGQPQPNRPTPPISQPQAAPVISAPPAAPNLTASGIKPPKRRRLLPWIISGLGVLVILLIIAGVAGYLWYKSALAPVSSTYKGVSVSIESGATVSDVAKKLEQSGLVKSALITEVYMRLKGKTNVKAGHYELSPNQPVSEIVAWLNDGRVDTIKLTIYPGQTLGETRQSLINYGYSAESVDAALAKKYDHPLLKDKPADANLQGYIYPETYFVNSGGSVEQLLVRVFDEFEAQINNNKIREGLSKQGLNLHQGVILASIVGAEVPGYEDRRKVAQVFEKRLRENMVLGSDITYIYIAKQMGIQASPDIDSPYNTRKFPGLPPGPLSNFNLAALQAVADPATTDYLYFVAGDDGITHFSHTAEEHELNVSRYCQKLCFSN